MVAADARTAITFSLSPGQAHDAPEGRKLLTRLGPQCPGPFLLMDRAYEGNETRQLALALGFMPVVPPLILQLQKCGEEFQAASVMAAPGRCLVPPSPPGPPQH